MKIQVEVFRVVTLFCEVVLHQIITLCPKNTVQFTNYNATVDRYFIYKRDLELYLHLIKYEFPFSWNLQSTRALSHSSLLLQTQVVLIGIYTICFAEKFSGFKSGGNVLRFNDDALEVL
jgi:hypothetical protein